MTLIGEKPKKVETKKLIMKKPVKLIENIEYEGFFNFKKDYIGYKIISWECGACKKKIYTVIVDGNVIFGEQCSRLIIKNGEKIERKFCIDCFLTSL